jgi:hypothetical protein
MKHFLSVAILVTMVTLFLSAWSVPARAAGATTSAKRQAAHGVISSKVNLATSPSLRGLGEFYAVSAVSASDMWAVGDGVGTLIEHWNGTQWSLVKSVNPGLSFNHLYSVAAISANDVWAVGSWSNDPTNEFVNTLIEHWNGTQWSVVSSSSPGTTTNILYGVVAISANDVWAVGIYDYSTLIEHWNGTTWRVVSSPSPGSSNFLTGVTAVSTSNVWAVGYSFGAGDSGSGSQTLIEQWNGTMWSVIPSSNSASQFNYLNGVAAVSASDIWAVGYSNSGSTSQTLIEQWNGSIWSIVSSPNPGSTGDSLYAVTAISANNVWAVGTGSGTLTVRWNGTKWSVVSSPNVGTVTNRLNGVTRVSASDVWAVGAFSNGPPTYQTLTEQWNGTQWSLITSPNQIGNGTLTSVAAVSATDSWAVGTDDSGGLIERWNGSTWSFESSPNPELSVHFGGVAAASASDIWAVGSYFTTSGARQTITEHWNGAKWSIIPSPNSGLQINHLASVAVLSSTNVWAVGYYEDSSGNSQTLIEQWNGTKWSIVPNPNPGASGNALNAVVAVSASDVWAVGYQVNSSGVQQTLIEQWNGKHWSVVSSPSPGSSANTLAGVTAVSARNVWAIGSADAGTLIEQWNGTQWSVVTSPSPGSFGNALFGVAAASASNVWAVGDTSPSNGIFKTLIERWNGSSWSTVTSPSPGSIGNVLTSVAVVSASNAWAVGQYVSNLYATQSLVEHWNGSMWSVVPSPNVATLLNSRT